MAKPIWGFTPPGGWHYYESDVRLDAITLDGLYETVTNYRAENHLPLGDVEGDVNSFLCSNSPSHCHGVDMVAITSVAAQTPAAELLQDITIWARNLAGSKNQHLLVSDDLAEQRAKKRHRFVQIGDIQRQVKAEPHEFQMGNAQRMEQMPPNVGCEK
jgi:hypothetical protein